MALAKIEDVDLQLFDQWLANIVDTLNYDLGKIGDEVPVLEMILSNIDTAPVKDLKESLDRMVGKINEALQQIDERLMKLEQRSR